MILLPLLIGLALLQWGVMGGFPIETNTIVRLGDRAVLTEEQLFSQLATHEIVLIGEEHDNPAHHQVQLTVIRALHARHPDMAIALEMFPRTLQPELDRWVAGEYDEAAFLDAVEWYLTWGMPAELYMPIFRWARTHRIPLLAMNLPRETVSSVRKKGLISLDPELHASLPPICTPVTAYRIRLEEVFNAHPMMSQTGQFNHFVEAQTLWDSVMADTIRKQRQTHPDRLIVALAGSGHLIHGHGIPHQLRSRHIEDLVTLLPWSVDANWISPDAADFAWGTDEAPDDPPPLRLGVVLDDQRKDGAWIVSVSANSPASKAGLQAGDRLLTLNDQNIRSRHALVRLLQERKHGTPVRIRLQRADQEQEVEITPERHTMPGK
ncbi:MAG: PDZ domain-containing protein [Magnetococcales bacterium]|nr:ChaN family lipoprotein [Magnetococcales bacterium]NGZ06093.1 PDZ domain-containing protein [Magnetococcales bacterium]